MELNKEFIRWRTVSLDGVQSSGDYSLPDYQGDVRKILFSEATLQDGGRFHNADTLECIGTVTYKIVYIDAEGRITPVSFTSDYEMNVRCPSEVYEDSDVCADISSFSLRLLGPRRFCAKCSIEAKVAVAERAERRLEDNCGGAPLEMRTEDVGVATAAFARSSERELAEELVHLEGAIADEVEVLVHSAEAGAVSIQRTEGGATVRSQICVRALIAVGADMPRMHEGVLDLCAEVDLPDGAEEGALLPSVSLLSESISAAAVEDGVSIVMSVIAEARVSHLGNTSVTLLKDCFSTAGEVECVSSDMVYSAHVGSRMICERITYSAPREAVGAENVRNVLYESARVKTESVRAEAENVTISGSIHVGAIACEIGEDGMPTYAPLRFEVQFAINVNFGCQIPENMQHILQLSLESPHIDLDEGEVKFSGNLTGAISVTSELREPCVGAVSLTGEGVARESSVVSVYYPEGGESLFDVAKKFRVSPMAIARDNELSESACSGDCRSLAASGVEYLLIR